MSRRFVTIVLYLVAPAMLAVCAEEPNRIEVVKAFRAARDAGDYELARRFLSAARYKFDFRQGPSHLRT